MAKKRIVIDYEKLPDEIINRIKLEYPDGFEENLVTFTNAQGMYVSALPFDTEEIYYLVRMTEKEARRIIKEDDDYDDDGKLRDDFEDDVNAEGEKYLDDNIDEAESIEDNDDNYDV